MPVSRLCQLSPFWSVACHKMALYFSFFHTKPVHLRRVSAIWARFHGFCGFTFVFTGEIASMFTSVRIRVHVSAFRTRLISISHMCSPAKPKTDLPLFGAAEVVRSLGYHKPDSTWPLQLEVSINVVHSMANFNSYTELHSISRWGPAAVYKT